MKKIKHWWRKQETNFKWDFTFQAIMLFIGIILSIVFGNPALICITISLIIVTLSHSCIFRAEKYVFTKVIKHHKDFIHTKTQLIKTYEELLNSTYVLVPWSKSEKFTSHKRFNKCYAVEHGYMVPYDIYIEISKM